MVPSADSEEGQMQASSREVRVGTATLTRDAKGEGKSVARGKSTGKGEEKAREGGVDGDVEMGAGSGDLGQSSSEWRVICQYAHFTVFLPFSRSIYSFQQNCPHSVDLVPGLFLQPWMRIRMVMTE